MGYNAKFKRLPLAALFDLKGDWADLKAWCGAALPVQPAKPNNLTRENETELMFVGPRRYLLRGGDPKRSGYGKCFASSRGASAGFCGPCV